MKLYINGIQVTALSTATYPAQNSSGYINSINLLHTIGNAASNLSQNFDGYMAEVNFIDGQALTPTSFGELDVNTGVWIPKAYTGTYGTNGFNLKFSDIALTTSSNTGLGKDFANSNYWTTNDISVTSGSTYDAMTDSPTNTSETIGNYATLNPLNKPTNIVLANGNLQATNTVGTIENVRSTIPTDNTYSYWEWVATTVGSSLRIEIGGILSTANVSNTSYLSNSTGAFSATWDVGLKVDVNGSRVYSNGSDNLVANDIIQFAYDKSTGKLWIGLNNTWYNSGNPVAGTGNVTTLTAVSIFPAVMVNGGGGTNSIHANFGQRPFKYTPPTGFKRLNTFNLPTPTIGSTEATLASKFMDITLYIGNGTNQSIGNSGFQPDLVWIKNRTSATDHAIYDSVRGATKQLSSNTTGVETTELTGLTSFNTVGFSVGSIAAVNTNGNNYIAWQWRAGAAPVTITGGTIQSTVSVNTTSGFSVVSYTGNGNAGATIGHGLGVAPKMIIVKNRSNAGNNWPVYTAMVGNASTLFLSSTSLIDTGTSYWNNTNPTSSVFSVGTSSGMNGNTQTYIAYAWAEIDGFSKFNSYIGNANADGPFVYTGFRPEFILIKCSSTTGNWAMFNSAANTSNPVINELLANTSAAENSIASNDIDFLSNGFKLRSTNGDINASTATYIYAAFAEFPTKYANAALTQSLKPTIAVDYLVVAGGGSGGGFIGGGGGAGGFIGLTGQTIEVGRTHSLIVGSGGAGGSGLGTSGSNSIFSSINSIGGGRGGSWSTTVAGADGGSGGGGSPTGAGGSASPTGQGNNGGAGGASFSANAAGGGGGASGVGGSGAGTIGGNGGNGLTNPILESTTGQLNGGTYYLSGGGGGAKYTSGTPGIGGIGGGGNGSVVNPITNGTPNTGGGGGGNGNGTGGSGGSGVVIIRIPSTHVGLFSSGVGYTYSAISNNNIYTITGTTTTGETVSFVKSGDVVTVDYLVVAGGGGGGWANGGYTSGGGGAGGLRSTVTATGGGGLLEPTLTLNKNITYSIVVGGPGAAGTAITNGGIGSNSNFHTIVSIGGGGGGFGRDISSGNGTIGGSGGGGGSQNTTAGNTAGSPGTVNQGYSGGSGRNRNSDTANMNGGGGGGAFVAGTSGDNNTLGLGGNGVSVNINGNLIPYAGGGGGGSAADGNASGGTGGGGTGGGGTLGSALPGSANTGGGGGGGQNSNTGNTSAAGGSGIVIIRIPNTVTAQFSQYVGFTYTGITNYNIYTITATTAINQTVTFV
jgi:hypothetical protein